MPLLRRDKWMALYTMADRVILEWDLNLGGGAQTKPGNMPKAQKSVFAMLCKGNPLKRVSLSVKNLYLLSGFSLIVQRNCRQRTGSFAWGGLNIQLSPQELYPIGNIIGAHPLEHLLRIETNTVIFNE